MAEQPEQDGIGLVRALLKLGIPVSKLAEIPGLTAGLGGINGLLGLVQSLQAGNVPGAIGGAANVGSGIANLAGFPGVSQGLGSIGGPLSLATGLASGDPLQSALGGLQTASLASGALGGPTLGSAAASGLGAVGVDAASLAAMGGLGGLSAALAPAALTLMLGAVDFGGVDLFDSIFGNQVSHAQHQMDEWKQYAEDFPGLAERRVAGAKQFDSLGEMDTPDEIRQALTTAASGVHANTEPAAWNVGHTPGSLKFDAPDMSGWNAASPKLSGHNQAAFLNLMDKGQAAGLDTGGMTGDWNLGQYKPFSEDGRQVYGSMGPNTTGEDYRTRLGVNQSATGDPAQTQEAQDLGNAVSGLAGDLGVDLRSKGPGDYENFNSGQLEGYGFTPGNYGQAALNYLRSFDPNVVNHPDWGSYTQALGDPSALGLLNLIPRERPQLQQAPPELNLGGE